MHSRGTPRDLGTANPTNGTRTTHRSQPDS
ncbi:hypothetical protein FAGKG844_100001 [Frankia sp. AgKG'84/4]